LPPPDAAQSDPSQRAASQDAQGDRPPCQRHLQHLTHPTMQPKWPQVVLKARRQLHCCWPGRWRTVRRPFHHPLRVMSINCLIIMYNKIKLRVGGIICTGSRPPANPPCLLRVPKFAASARSDPKSSPGLALSLSCSQVLVRGQAASCVAEPREEHHPTSN
jgi:hypothetical protein